MFVKAFIIIFLTLMALNTNLLFDLDLSVLHQEFNDHLNQALAPFRIGAREIPVEFSYFVFALIGSLISFVVVRIHIKFAYYFYCYTAQDEESGNINKEGMDDAQQIVAERFEDQTKKMRKMYNILLHVNFLSPVLAIIVMVNPLS